MNRMIYEGNEQIIISVGTTENYVLPCQCGGRAVKIGDLASDNGEITVGGKNIDDGIDATCAVCGSIIPVFKRGL